MTDDDELRDDFGDEVAVSMAGRDDGTPPVEAVFATVQRSARTRRLRRGAATATIAAAVAAVVVALAISGGGGKQVQVEETPTSTSTPTVSAGHRLVSYHGVHVEVPATWPVLDGMHTTFCSGPFSEDPAAYLGPNDNAPPSCPAPLPGRVVRLDSVWLDESATPGPSARRVTTASGEDVLEVTPEPRSQSLRLVWFRGVLIEIGVGADPAIAQAIFDSIGYTAGAPDTAAAGVCARSATPDAMPEPERLASRLTLEQGTVVLDPPRPDDQPGATADDVWRAHTSRANYEHYRLILTRYTAATPASPNGAGGYTPDHVDMLAWVIYATPVTDIPGCGFHGVDLFDARTGAELESTSYGPGP